MIFLRQMKLTLQATRIAMPCIIALLLAGESARATIMPAKQGDSGIDHGVRWEAYVLKEGDTPKGLFGEWSKYVVIFNRKALQFWKPGAVIKKPLESQIDTLMSWTPMPAKFGRCPGKKKQQGMCIVVSLSSQFLGVYRNERLTESFAVSTGLPGYETPTGEYMVLSASPGRKLKLKRIFSYTYKTWMRWPLPIGHEMFIHAGNLPGYPASHGCIRMMKLDAYKLQRMTPLQTPVVIID